MPRHHCPYAFGCGPFAIENDRGAEPQAGEQAVGRARTRRRASTSRRTGRRPSREESRRRNCAARARRAAHGRRLWGFPWCPRCRSRARDRRRLVRARRSPVRAFSAAVQSRALLAVRGHDGRRRRQRLRERGERGGRVGFAPDVADFAVADDRRQVGERQARIDADRDAACPDRAEIGDDPVDAVRREDDDARSCLETERTPCAAARAHGVAQLAIADALVAALERHRGVGADREQAFGRVHAALRCAGSCALARAARAGNARSTAPSASPAASSGAGGRTARGSRRSRAAGPG